MMLVMQAHIIRQRVQGPVIRECLRQRHLCHSLLLLRHHPVATARFPFRGAKGIMLSDEVGGARVQGASEEGAEDEVGEGAGAGMADEEGVEGELGDDVEGVDAGQRQAVDEHGPQGVEEDLEGAEEGFAEDGVQEEGFERGGEVGVEAVDAERFVVR
jgi:hypothetical protein